MSGENNMTAAKRDAELASALMGALQAMMLTQGATITILGVTGSLNFEPQIVKVTEALSLLAAEPDDPLSPSAAAGRADRHV